MGKNVNLLLIVNLLHFAGAGFIIPVLSNHIVNCGGSMVLLGVLCSATVVCNMVSRTFMRLFYLTRKRHVQLCLFCAFFITMGMGFITNTKLILLNRCAYALTAQVSWYSKEYVTRTEIEYVKYCNFLNMIKVIGMVIGTLCSGHLYDTYGFDINVTVTTAFRFLCLNNDPLSSRRPSRRFLEIPGKCYEALRNLLTTNLYPKRRIVLILSAYTFCFTIYASRHVFILRSIYRYGTIIIGYQAGYQYMVKFTCEVFLPPVVSLVQNKKRLFNLSVALCALVMVGPAPNLIVFWMRYIPSIIGTTIIDQLMVDDVLELKSDPQFYEAMDTLRVIINIVGPILFGCLTQKVGPSSIKLVLYMFPLAAFSYLTGEYL